jgi:CPA1 family monovalent cation:H+ antiporter
MLPQQLVFLAVILTLALVLEPVARRLRLPFAAVLLGAGFAGSELYVAAGLDTGIRAGDFHDLILYVLLPVLVFQSALDLDPRALLRNLAPILLLALAGTTLGALVAGGVLYLGIGHPSGFPWLTALVAGVLLSATDPAAVLSLLARLGVPERLTVITEGESLFNDAVAIVLFQLVLALALAPGPGPGAAGVAFQFLWALGAGLATGALVGLVLTGLLRWAPGWHQHLAITILAAYGAFFLAEKAVGGSGVMAVLGAGLVLARGLTRRAGPEVAQVWSFNAWAANTLVFLLMGVTVTTEMFTERWLAMLLGIGAALVARALIYALLPAVRWLPPGEPLPLAQRTLLYWVGVRGAVTLALALSLPVELEGWWTVQSAAFGVVLFSVLVQVPTASLLARHLPLGKRGRRD